MTGARIALSATLALAGTALGQQADGWAERHHRAKFGRQTPAAEARQKADQANTAFHQDSASKSAGPRDPRTEAYFLTKFGRGTPAQEAADKAVRANTAFHQESTAKPEPSRRWLVDYLKAKFGRAPAAGSKQ